MKALFARRLLGRLPGPFKIALGFACRDIAPDARPQGPPANGYRTAEGLDVDTLAVGTHHRQLVLVRTGSSDVFLHCRPCFRWYQQDEEIAADQFVSSNLRPRRRWVQPRCWPSVAAR